MSDDHDPALDATLRQSLAGAVSPTVEERLRNRLAEFRSQLETGPATVRPPRGRSMRAARWGIGTACVAATILLIVGPSVLVPRTTFAQVVKAVQKQPWIHTVSEGEGSQKFEEWASASRGIYASRWPGSIDYRDGRLQVYDRYESAEGVIYRGPDSGPSQSGEIESVVSALGVLLQGEHLPDQPLEQLTFFGAERSNMKVVDQAVERVRDGGRDWLVYRLTFTHTQEPQPFRMTFRVDAATKLPASSRIELTHDGRTLARETRFDYPATGPADIYALGVPRTAKLVDRLPKGDLARILDTIQAGRERMDNYRALYTMRVDWPGYAWWAYTPVVLYRKGYRYRADYPAGVNGDQRLGMVKHPADGEGVRAWWFERIKSIRYFPRYVVSDSRRFAVTPKSTNDLDGTPRAKIESVQVRDSRQKPQEDFPPEWSMRPEFRCRPPLGIGAPHFEPVLDLHPADGPPGCVLLTIRHTSKQGRMNEKGFGIPDGERYWLDPARDYIMVRSQTVQRGPDGREAVVAEEIIEETARSPQGVWYATKIRQKDIGNNTPRSDALYYLYVEFPENLPDSLFEPPVVGKVY